MKKRLTQADRKHVLAVLETGKSVRATAAETGVSKSTVHEILRSSPLKRPNPRGGRPRKLSDRIVRELAKDLTRNRLRSAKEAVHKALAVEDVEVSPTTIRRNLHRHGLRAVKKKKKPLLRPHHRAQRLKFSKKYAAFTVDDWKTVVFSDETKINVFGADSGNRWVWKDAEAPFGPREVLPTVKFGGGSLMLWGCITAAGVGGFCRIHGNLDSELYCQILEGELMDTIEKAGLGVDTVIFQHDNDPKHTSKRATKCLEELGLDVLDWPAQSPDLNPIEHLWRELKIKLNTEYSSPPGGVEELWRRVQEQWESIPKQTVIDLIESMPDRVAAVLKAKGGYTKY